MESNIAITEAEAGSDMADIPSRDLRMCSEKIGSGSLNDVYRGKLRRIAPRPHCWDVYAVKKIARDTSFSPASFVVKEIKASAAVLQSDTAPDGGFVKLVGLSADDRYFYLVQEFMEGGDLGKYIEGPWLEEDAKILGRQLFTKMKFMYEKKLMHLDLKPGVIYPKFKDDGSIQFKVSDLGVSKRIAFDTTWPLELKKIISGRPRERAYMAPEFYEFNGDTRVFTNRADSWSVGCILYRVITGADIFPNLVTMVKYFNCGHPSPREGLTAKRLSETGILFIESLLHENPQHRLSATAALEHPWLEIGESHQLSESLKEKLHMGIEENTQRWMACDAPECDVHQASIPGSPYIMVDNPCLQADQELSPTKPFHEPSKSWHWLWSLFGLWG